MTTKLKIAFDATPCAYVQPNLPPERQAFVYGIEARFWRSPYLGEDLKDRCVRLDGGVLDRETWSGIPLPEPLDLGEAAKTIERLWVFYLKEKAKKLSTDPLIPRQVELLEEPEIGVKLVQVSEWWCTWFAHRCRDVDQSDSEAVASFERYVSWVLSLPKRRLSTGTEYEPLCLMGAEDRWRWRSGSDEYEKIPCRCVHCKEQGVLRIAH